MTTRWAVGLLACVTGCRAAPAAVARAGDGPAQVADRGLDHQALVQRFAAHDRADNWSQPACRSIEHDFVSLGEAPELGSKRRSGAIYNAGLARQRCGDHGMARAHFEHALRIDAGNQHAALALASYALRSGGDGLDAAIELIEQATRAAENPSAEALVRLAELQRRRGRGQGGRGCQGDLDCATKNLQRALALDDGSPAALHQLVLIHLARVQPEASATLTTAWRRRPRGRTTAPLDQAAQACARLLQTFPGYAPGHNTAGQIEAALGNPERAALAFEAAVALDAHLFEAWMNLAAVRLTMRHFATAEAAYRRAVALRGDDYEAHLGLGLALRGQLRTDASDEAKQAVMAQLERAWRLEPNRPEAYYNGVIFVHEFLVLPAETPREKAMLTDTLKELYRAFLRRAGEDPAYAAAVQRAKVRMSEFEPVFLIEGLRAAGDEPAAVPALEELETSRE